MNAAVPGSPLLSGHSPFVARRSMAACAADTQMLFFGGVGAQLTESILDIADDCWRFDTRELAWHPVPKQGAWPAARRCAGFSSGPGAPQLWGGSGVSAAGDTIRHTFLNDWWTLDVSDGTWSCRRHSDDHRADRGTAGSYPEPRYTPSFGMCGAHLVLFGGYTEDWRGSRKMNDLWLLDGDVWHQVCNDGPSGYDSRARWPGVRYGSMSAFTERGMFVCGGFSDAGDHNDLWMFDIAERRWRQLAPDAAGAGAPPPRYCAMFACDADRLILFGGRSRREAKVNYNDLWIFDLRDGRWQCVSGVRGPHRYDVRTLFPAYHAKSSVAVVEGCCYLWGGEGLHGHVSDFWRLSLATLEWQMIQAARPDDPAFW